MDRISSRWVATDSPSQTTQLLGSVHVSPPLSFPLSESTWTLWSDYAQPSHRLSSCVCAGSHGSPSQGATSSWSVCYLLIRSGEARDIKRCHQFVWTSFDDDLFSLRDLDQRGKDVDWATVHNATDNPWVPSEWSYVLFCWLLKRCIRVRELGRMRSMEGSWNLYPRTQTSPQLAISCSLESMGLRTMGTVGTVSRFVLFVLWIRTASNRDDTGAQCLAWATSSKWEAGRTCQSTGLDLAAGH